MLLGMFARALAILEDDPADDEAMRAGFCEWDLRLSSLFNRENAWDEFGS